MAKGEDKEDTFLQSLSWPEEDRHLYTSAPYDGGYRWFRSPNIYPIERYRNRPAKDDRKDAA